jgi:lysophospholipase L1-like esterase
MGKFKLRLRKQYLFTVLLICSTTVFILLLGEVISLFRFTLPTSYYIWKPDFKMLFNPYPDVMPGISGPSWFITNSHGIRGDELMPSHTYRILAIGGSSTECLFLDQSETWPYLLQKTLNKNTSKQNIWVGNAGMSGKTTRHHLTAMQYLPLRKMRIDTIILLIGINDFSKRISQNESYDQYFLSNPGATEKQLNDTFAGGYPHQDDPFFKKTAIWQMLRKVKTMVFRKKTKFYVQDKAGQNYVTWRKYRHEAAEIINELPDLSSALEEYARNINKMMDIAQENSIRLIFITQPTMWKRDLPGELDALLWFGGIGDFQMESHKSYYSSEALATGIQKYNDTLLNICQERQLECVDLSTMLEKDTTVFYDDVHFNESGARKVSIVLSNYILSHDPFIRSNVPGSYMVH